MVVGVFEEGGRTSGCFVTVGLVIAITQHANQGYTTKKQRGKREKNKKRGKGIKISKGKNGYKNIISAKQ